MRDALVLAVVLVAAAPSFAGSGSPLTQKATVVHVDDGDTIDVWIDGRRERVRYIGIDAPEVAHDGVGGAPGGEAATRLNQALLRGRRVGLEFDRERRDRYGRLLAYVWVGDVMINVEMVRRGYARVLTIPPNVRYARRFARAEAAARASHRGLWGEGALDHPPTTRSRWQQARGSPGGFRLLADERHPHHGHGVVIRATHPRGRIRSCGQDEGGGFLSRAQPGRHAAIIVITSATRAHAPNCHAWLLEWCSRWRLVRCSSGLRVAGAAPGEDE